MNRSGVLAFWSDAELAAIQHAFMSTGGSESRWRDLAAKGATDAELRKAISRELGIYGGASGGPGMAKVVYKGGADPRIWLHQISPDGTPSLQGKELLRAARAIFGIGQPVTEDQMRLL